jgi:hypothetical protein
MSDPFDSLLARLSAEPPSRDLAARIQAAVARRQRTLVVWRRIQALAILAASIGLLLVLLSWAPVTDGLGQLWDTAQAAQLGPAYSALTAAPVETLGGWLDAGLAWQAAQAQDIGLLFTLGIGLLSVGAFAGLARLLNNTTPGQISR